MGGEIVKVKVETLVPLRSNASNLIHQRPHRQKDADGRRGTPKSCLPPAELSSQSPHETPGRRDQVSPRCPWSLRPALGRVTFSKHH